MFVELAERDSESTGGRRRDTPTTRRNGIEAGEWFANRGICATARIVLSAASDRADRGDTVQRDRRVGACISLLPFTMAATLYATSGNTSAMLRCSSVPSRASVRTPPPEPRRRRPWPRRRHAPAFCQLVFCEVVLPSVGRVEVDRDRRSSSASSAQQQCGSSSHFSHASATSSGPPSQVLAARHAC